MKFIKSLAAFLAVFFFTSETLCAESLVSGRVLEIDGQTGIAGASVVFSGLDADGDTLVFSFLSDTLGCYLAEVEPGCYAASAWADGFVALTLADSVTVAEDQTITELDFLLAYLPVRHVSAQLFNNALVQVSWTMDDLALSEDFESGGFGLPSWNNMISDYPWRVDTIRPFGGRYCMKSTCEGQGSGSSDIEVAVFVPSDGWMSFMGCISSENPWDVGRFYVDGIKKLECSGEGEWEEHVFEITEGEHVFRWSYVKDASMDANDDCFYVDDICFWRDSGTRDFQYFNLYRRRLDAEPAMLASHLADLSFMDMAWSGLPWGVYQWGVECVYDHGTSDTVWSGVLDKDMTTTFALEVTTNIGSIPAGASVSLDSYNGQGESYNGILDDEGHLLLSEVYRDEYRLLIHLDGFLDFVSDEPVAISEPTTLSVELAEGTNEIDSLYVSSTGWAIWSLEETRGLQRFEIMLDSIPVDSVSTMFYGFYSDTLTVGRTHQVMVRPVYLSGNGTLATCSWTVRSCADFQGTVWGIEGESVPEGHRFSWTYPEADSLLGAVFFRGDEFLGFTTDNFFVDSIIITEPGTYWWYVRLVYDGQACDSYYSMSCFEEIQFYIPIACDAPSNLEGENYFENPDDYGALISWGERPEPIEGWLFYDNGNYATALGADGLIFWAVKFETDDLLPYLGASLSQISIYDVAAGTYQVWIYVGGESEPQALAHYQNIELEGTHGWYSVSLENSVQLPGNEPVWIVVGQQGVAFPAAACTDTGNANGRWVSLDGLKWVDMSFYNLHYTWMLRAFVTDQRGNVRQLDNEGSSLEYFNLYRSYFNDDYSLVAQIPFVEGVQFYQYHDVLVGDSHQQFYYQLTAVYSDGCESEPAASIENPSQNYVVVDDAWRVAKNGSQLVLFPNPVADLLRVEAEAMRHVAFVNSVGQTVFSIDVESNVLTVNLSGFPDGLYLVQIETADGTLSKRLIKRR